MFQSTLPVRGATRALHHQLAQCRRFNPRSPCGERPPFVSSIPYCLMFQSTLPVRGATLSRYIVRVGIVVSIHAPRAGSDGRFHILVHCTRVSIHAPRAGSDFPACRCSSASCGVSIHAPRAGSDAAPPRPAAPRRVSIHAPRAGSDFLPFFLAPFSSSFQSTLPVRGATSRARPADGSRERFNPRSPCGERHRQPARAGLNHVVSIHAPRAGSDRADRVDQIHDPRFNPRSPCGERPGRPAAHAR